MHQNLNHLSVLSALSLLVAFAHSECQLVNAMQPGQEYATNEDWCMRQGPGDYTFTMGTGSLVVPTFNSGAPFAGYVGGYSFLIYDEACNVKGVYTRPNDNDCGVPFTIKDSYLPYVLTITNVRTSPGDGDYDFTYANGKYSIRNDGCVCTDVHDDVHAKEACRCAFPINGEA